MDPQNRYKIEAKTRCKRFKYLIIPDKVYYNKNLNIRNIIDDLEYLIYRTSTGYGIYNLFKNIQNVKKKFENKNYFCKFYACNYILFDVYDRESTYIFLAILDYILKKIFSDSYFKKLKEEIEKKLNVGIYYPSLKKPVNNSS